MSHVRSHTQRRIRSRVRRYAQRRVRCHVSGRVNGQGTSLACLVLLALAPLFLCSAPLRAGERPRATSFETARALIEETADLRKTDPLEALEVYRQALPYLPDDEQADLLSWMGRLTLQYLPDQETKGVSQLRQAMSLAASAGAWCIYGQAVRYLSLYLLNRPEDQEPPIERLLDDSLAQDPDLYDEFPLESSPGSSLQSSPGSSSGSSLGSPSGSFKDHSPAPSAAVRAEAPAAPPFEARIESWLEVANTHMETCPADEQTRTWNMRAQLYRVQLRQAEQYAALVRALQVAEPGTVSALYAEYELVELLHDLGDVTGEGEAYRVLLDEALALEQYSKVVDILLALAALELDLDRPDLARIELEHARDTAEEHGLEVERALTLARLAQVAILQGDLAEATRLLDAVPEALISQQILRRRLTVLYIRGMLKEARGDLAGAEAAYRFIAGEPQTELETRWRAQAALARVVSRAGAPHKARQILWETVNELETQRRKMSDSVWTLAYKSQRLGLYLRWLEGLVDAWEEGGGRVMWPPEDGKEGGGRTAWSPENGRNLPAEGGARPAETGVRRDNTDWNPARAFVTGPVTADDLLAAVEKVSSQALTAALYRDHGALAGLGSHSRALSAYIAAGGWVSGASLRQLLPPGLPCYIYQPLSHEILLLEVWRDRVYPRRIPFDQAHVAAVRKVQEAMNDTFNGRPEGLETLGELLVSPIVARLPGPSSPAAFVMEGELQWIPIAALFFQGRYLVERVAPFELPNLSALRSIRPQKRPPTLKAVGVAFGDDLPAARQEVALLERPGLDAHILTGEDARKRVVKAYMSGADLLHFATHAESSSRSVKASLLLQARGYSPETDTATAQGDGGSQPAELAVAATDGADHAGETGERVHGGGSEAGEAGEAGETGWGWHGGGGEALAVAKRGEALEAPPDRAYIKLNGSYLTVDELEGTTLHAHLTVFSGCRTRLGSMGYQEHSPGALHRAALVAGSEAVIASRWKVGDEATYALMKAFYAAYPDAGRALSLARAQRAMIESHRQTRSHSVRKVFLKGELQGTPTAIPYSAPWSWAAFTLVGRWD